jgi:hypothetical protein
MLRTDKGSGRGTFDVLSHKAVVPELLPSMVKLMASAQGSGGPALIAHAPDATPLKRMRDLAFSPPDAASTPSSLATRRRLE